MRTSRLRSALRCGLLSVALSAAHAVGGTASAFAQPVRQAPEKSAKVAEAELLFKRAAAHMDAREYDAACPLLERSNALDPSSGTLLNLAECYEQRGLTASAYGTFEAARDVSTRTGRTDRAEVAELRKRRLEPLLRRLTIVPPSAPPKTLLIQLDGKPLATALWNVPVPVDPGAHLVRASADSVPDYATRVPAPEVGATTSVPILLPQRAQPETDRSAHVDGQRIGAIACGVLGAAGVVTGTVFGLRSQSKHEQSDKYCTGGRCLDARGVTLMEDARSAGTVSTVSFIVGGVGLGAAAVLWFVRPFGRDAAGAAVEVGVGPAAIRVAGRW
jgi:hypothetical protein